jgi:hypothetical protein
MCDYSLQHLASRPAKAGDSLVTTRFKHSVTGGFCSIGEPNIAVCLMPGTEVAFEREIERLALFRMRPKKLGSKVARFRRVNPDCPTMHHDALELPTGEIVLLTRLREGQFATVIQMPATEHQYVATGRATAELAPSPLTPR